MTLEPNLQVFHFLIAAVETGPAFELAKSLCIFSVHEVRLGDERWTCITGVLNKFAGGLTSSNISAQA